MLTDNAQVYDTNVAILLAVSPQLNCQVITHAVKVHAC